MPAQAADASAHANRPQWLNYQEGDFVIRNYVFRSGETKVGQPVRPDHRARQQAFYNFSSRSCFTSARPALRM